jgi:coenzyme PQQ precursor peptide PqqA
VIAATKAAAWRTAGTFGSPSRSDHGPGRPGRRIWARSREKDCRMTWTTPTFVEICIGLEINGYLPPEI